MLNAIMTNTAMTAAEVSTVVEKVETDKICVVCHKPFTPKRSDAIYCDRKPSCRLDLFRAYKHNEFLKNKPLLDKARKKQKTCPEALALIEAYEVAMRRDAADSLYGGTVNASTRDYRHDRSKLSVTRLIVTKEDMHSGKPVATFVNRFGGDESAARSRKIRYGVPKPSVADFPPLYLFIDDEDLAAEYKEKYEKKLARVPRQSLSKQQAEKNARRHEELQQKKIDGAVVPAQRIGGVVTFIPQPHGEADGPQLPPLVGGVIASGGVKLNPTPCEKSDTTLGEVCGIRVEAEKVVALPAKHKPEKCASDGCLEKRCIEFKKFREALKQKAE